MIVFLREQVKRVQLKPEPQSDDDESVSVSIAKKTFEIAYLAEYLCRYVIGADADELALSICDALCAKEL